LISSKLKTLHSTTIGPFRGRNRIITGLTRCIHNPFLFPVKFIMRNISVIPGCRMIELCHASHNKNHPLRRNPSQPVLIILNLMYFLERREKEPQSSHPSGAEILSLCQPRDGRCLPSTTN